MSKAIRNDRVGLFETISINIDTVGVSSIGLNDIARGAQSFTSSLKRSGAMGGLLTEIHLADAIHDTWTDLPADVKKRHQIRYDEIMKS